MQFQIHFLTHIIHILSAQKTIWLASSYQIGQHRIKHFYHLSTF